MEIVLLNILFQFFTDVAEYIAEKTNITVAINGKSVFCFDFSVGKIVHVLDHLLNWVFRITVLDVAVFIAAVVFLVLCYRKVKDYLIAKHDADKLRDEQLQEALTAVRKYPEYRKQSIQIQHELENENGAVRKDIQALAKRIEKNGRGHQTA